MKRERTERSRLLPILGGLLAAAGLVCIGSVMVSDREAQGVVSDSSSWADWDGTAVFLGDSITELCELETYYPGLRAENQGISGDTTAGMLNRLDSSVYAYSPDILVLHGGINDLFLGYEDDQIVENLCAIVRNVQQKLPDTEIVLQSLYPVAETGGGYLTEHIRAINARLEQLSAEIGCRYVDVYSALKMEDGSLRPAYSDDGLHPNDAGYGAACPVVADAIRQITG